jgi:hypothetical protein
VLRRQRLHAHNRPAHELRQISRFNIQLESTRLNARQVEQGVQHLRHAIGLLDHELHAFAECVGIERALSKRALHQLRLRLHHRDGRAQVVRGNR